MNLFFFGGTFDPPHLGHYEIASKCLTLADKVLVIPNNLSPEDKLQRTDAMHRFEMLKILFKNTEIEIDSYEISSNKINYTINTIKYLKNKYKDCKITMVVGLDQFQNLDNWYESKKIKELVDVVCFNRNEIDLKENIYKNKMINENLNINISSTQLRQAFKKKNNQIIKKYLNIDVLNYIKENNLYVI